MNVKGWIARFEGTPAEDEIDWAAPLDLPEVQREPLGRSLAIFQLGESGTGRTLRTYAGRIRGRKEFAGYERALELFVQEEHRHVAAAPRTKEVHLAERGWEEGSGDLVAHGADYSGWGFPSGAAGPCGARPAAGVGGAVPGLDFVPGVGEKNSRGQRNGLARAGS